MACCFILAALPACIPYYYIRGGIKQPTRFRPHMWQQANLTVPSSRVIFSNLRLHFSHENLIRHWCKIAASKQDYSTFPLNRPFSAFPQIFFYNKTTVYLQFVHISASLQSYLIFFPPFRSALTAYMSVQGKLCNSVSSKTMNDSDINHRLMKSSVHNKWI